MKGIHLLGPGYSRHHVHGKDGQTSVTGSRQQLFIAAGIEEGDQDLVRSHAIEIVWRRLTHPGKNINAANQFRQFSDNAGALFFVLRIAESCDPAGTRLHKDFMSEAPYPAGRDRRYGNAPFAFTRFIDGTYEHRGALLALQTI